MKKGFIRAAKICTVVFGFAFMVLATTNQVMLENETMVNSLFHQTSQIIVEKEDDAPVDTQYYKSKFSSVAEVIANSEQVSRDVVAEGITLLKNENNALPMPKGSKVSVFSISCTSPAYGGGGSSATSATCRDLRDCLKDSSVNLEVNDTLWNWYKDPAQQSAYMRTKVGGIGIKYSINDAPWSAIPDEAKNWNARTGIFFLSRLGTENEDLTVNTGDTTDMTNGSYLMLSPKEKEILKGMKGLKDNGTLSNIVLILNSPNQVETNFIDKEEYGIDAALWCGSFGTMGPKALADVLVGNVTPSGRLSDIYWQEHRFNPTMTNFVKKTEDGTGNAAYYYSGVTSTGETLDQAKYYYGGVKGAPYVVYQEGIYNGYRYAETRYDDYVCNAGNAGNFIYSDEITYPFGYGLSYTTFEYSNFNVTYMPARDQYKVDVKVTNTGETSGKEVVQIYLSKPYTQYDRDYHIEKSSVELVGFAKTKLLGKGDSDTVTIYVDKEYFASYDAYGYKTYIVDEGDYYLTAAKDSHDAINNIFEFILDKTSNNSINNPRAIDSSKMSYMPNHSTNGESLVAKFTEEFDTVTYSVTTDPVESGYKSEPTAITNQFDTADLNIYDSGSEDNKVTYISRNDWTGTVKYGLDENNNYLDNYVKLAWTSKLEHDVFEVEFNDASKLVDDVANPTMGSTKTSYSLINLKGIPADNEMWDDFLDQLTFDDMVTLLDAAFRHTEAVASIAKPATIDHNGAVGVVQAYGAGSYNRGLAVTTNDPDKNKVPPAYPCNGIVASTYNVDLIADYGEAWGEDCIWAGYSGLFGPGINGHRAAYSGRIFEYYSEDPFLSGKICAPLCREISKKGVYVYLKHACLNEQETCRTTLSTYANEQTIREVYLRGFEIAIEDGGAQCVMLGLNKIGPYETALTNLCNGVLRNEFGMTGHVITDYITDAKRYMMPYAHTMGCDLPDRDFQAYDYYSAYKTNHGKIVWGMRDACKHVLYSICNSNAMNGISNNTIIYSLTPQWKTVMSALVNILLILAIVSLALLIVLYAWPYAHSKGEDLINCFKRKTGKEVKESANKEKIHWSDISTEAYKTKKDPWYTHIIRGTIGAVGVILVIVQLVFMGDGLAKANETIAKAQGNNDGYINETAGGEGVKSNYFEAEAAEFNGVSCYGEDEGPKVKLASVSYQFGNFHSGIALSHIYSPTSYSEEDYNTLKFTFTSDKKVKVKVRVGVSCYRSPLGTYSAKNLSDYYKVTMNDKDVNAATTISPFTISNEVITTNGTTTFHYGMSYADIIIKINEGINVLKFTVLPQTGVNSTFSAFDYIDIRTSANLTDYVTHYWDTSDLRVTTVPTYTSQGVINECQTIPSINDGIQTGIYINHDTDEARWYTIGDTDVEVYRIEKNIHTLTIKSPYATFENEERTMTLKATEGLPSGLKTVSPDGYKYCGWVNYNDTRVKFDEKTFMMLDEDMEIAPYYEVTKKVDVNNPVTDEYTKIDNANIDEDYVINSSNTAATSGFEVKSLLNKIDTEGVIVNDDGICERATVFCYDNVPEANSKFALHNKFALPGKTTIIYNIQNQSSEPMTIDVARTHSSGDAFNISNPQKTVTLQPLEITSFALTLPTGHDTCITGIRIHDAMVTQMKIAINEYIKTGDSEKEEAGDIFVKLKGDVQFTDGTNYKMLSAGSSLPAVELTGESAGKEDQFLGWKDQDGNVYAKDGFKVPECDAIILTPFFTQETVRNGFGKLLFGSGYQQDGSYTAEGTYQQTYKGKLTKTGNVLIGEEYACTFRIDSASGGTDGTGTNAYTRMLTGYEASSGINTVYKYTFRNDGDKALTFEIYHRNSGSDTTAVDAKTITIAVGETQTVEITRTYSEFNNNILTYFRFDDSTFSSMVGGKFTMYVYALGEGDMCQVDLENAKFANGNTRAILQVGDKLPSLAEEYAYVQGVKDENNNYSILADYKVPAQQTTTLTVLEDESVKSGTGYLNMTEMKTVDEKLVGTCIDTYGVNCAYGISNHYTYIDGHYSTSFNFTGAGTGTDNTGTNASFRLRTMYDSANAKVDYKVTVKNMGSETLTFDVYGRGSGSDTSEATYYRISIAAGETSAVTVSWGKAVSSNLLVYFRFVEGCNYIGQRLAVNLYAQTK